MGISVDLLFEAVLYGVLLGGFYAAVSMGLSVSFGLLDVPNVAHPAIMVFGSYCTYLLVGLGIDPLLAGVLLMPPFFLLGMAKTNYTVARRFYSLSKGGARAGIAALNLNQFAAMPFDSLRAKAGSTTVSGPPLSYTRRIVVDSLSPRMARVTIVITPTNTLFKPDTLVLQRSKPGTSPFNSP